MYIGQGRPTCAMQADGSLAHVQLIQLQLAQTLSEHHTRSETGGTRSCRSAHGQRYIIACLDILDRMSCG